MRKAPGTVNGFVRSTAWINNKAFEFDGTTKGLTRSAIANGAKAGTIVLANFAGRIKSDARKMMIAAAPHDDRANGFWTVDVR